VLAEGSKPLEVYLILKGAMKYMHGGILAQPTNIAAGNTLTITALSLTRTVN
jgi:hypothetical protein